MATTITTTFVGTGAMDFVSKALLEATSLGNGSVTIIPNVKYSHKLQIADLSNIVQVDGCDFNDQGNITITERSLTPVKLKVNFKECKTTFESHWQSEKMLAGALNSSYTETFKSWILDYSQKQVAQGIERLMWQGATAGSGGVYATYPFLTSTNGFVATMLLDSDVIDVAGATLSVSNILAEVEKVHAAIPDVIYGDAGVKIFVSRKTMKFYKGAIQQTYGLANSNYDITKEGSADYKGIPLVVCGIADNTMVAAKSTNLYFGTDLVADYNEVRLLDFSETDLSDNIGFKMRFSADFNHGIGAEIVLYKL